MAESHTFAAKATLGITTPLLRVTLIDAENVLAIPGTSIPSRSGEDAANNLPQPIRRTRIKIFLTLRSCAPAPAQEPWCGNGLNYELIIINTNS